MQNRVIAHCDCNSFFASVELLRYPELAHKPVAVGGNEDNRHGIILAKNEAAKKFNVQTAETLWQARRKCPDLIVLPPHREQYQKYYKIINTIYSKYTDRVEPFGIDESWLDVSGSWQLFAPEPKKLADMLREEVFSETGLTISVGLSFNKMFAKLGSDYKKPNATTVITPENYKEILWPLPVGSMMYVGRSAAQILQEVGIGTIGQLAMADEDFLVQLLGKQGRMLRGYARGEDDSPVAYTGQSEPVKSVGNGRTFKRNLVGYQDIRTAVGSLADEVAGRLRSQKIFATTVQVVIKNTELKSISRQKQLSFATNLEKDITREIMELIQNNWDLSRPIRMLTVTATGLTEVPFAVQTSLFGEAPQIDTRRQKLENSMDKIREKYGRNSILQAGLLHNDLGLDSIEAPQDEGDEELEESSWRYTGGLQ